MREGGAFFCALLHAPIPRKAIENPVPHGYAVQQIGRYQQRIQPWMFGHGEQKATCFWLRNLRPLMPTHLDQDMFAQQEPSEREQRIHNLAPTPDRWKLRSATYQGIADAMAEQWG